MKHSSAVRIERVLSTGVTQGMSNASRLTIPFLIGKDITNSVSKLGKLRQVGGYTKQNFPLFLPHHGLQSSNTSCPKYRPVSENDNIRFTPAELQIQMRRPLKSALTTGVHHGS
jgi:hypothetical protein